jgi:hypothetical protein
MTASKIAGLTPVNAWMIAPTIKITAAAKPNFALNEPGADSGLCFSQSAGPAAA